MTLTNQLQCCCYLVPGVLYPEEWVQQIHAKSDSSKKYLVVLDVAAYVPTHALDLSAVKPDFVPISFYKVRESDTSSWRDH